MANRDNMHYTHGSFFVASERIVSQLKGEWALVGDDDYDNVTFTMNDGETAPIKEQVDTRTQELKDLWEHNRYPKESVNMIILILVSLLMLIIGHKKVTTPKMDEYVAKCDAVKSFGPKSASSILIILMLFITGCNKEEPHISKNISV